MARSATASRSRSDATCARGRLGAGGQRLQRECLRGVGDGAGELRGLLRLVQDVDGRIDRVGDVDDHVPGDALQEAHKLVVPREELGELLPGDRLRADGDASHGLAS
jgi:hypothetical protein